MDGNRVGGRVGTVSDDDAGVWTAGGPGLERQLSGEHTAAAMVADRTGS